MNKLTAVSATGSFSVNSSLCLSAGSEGRMILILGIDFCASFVAAVFATGSFSIDSSCLSAGSDGRMILILGMDFCASLVAFFCFDVERGPRTFFADSTFGVESRVATSR